MQDTVYCNSIGCPNDKVPIPEAWITPCTGNVCTEAECCQLHCSSYSCPDTFTPVPQAATTICDNQVSEGFVTSYEASFGASLVTLSSFLSDLLLLLQRLGSEGRQSTKGFGTSDSDFDDFDVLQIMYVTYF